MRSFYNPCAFSSQSPPVAAGALAEAHDNKSRAAEILKINRRLLYDKMQEFGID